MSIISILYTKFQELRLKIAVYTNERVAQLLFTFLKNLDIRKTATAIVVFYLEVIDFFTSATLVAVLVINSLDV